VSEIATMIIDCDDNHRPRRRTRIVRN
jgi:hypothetical protein